MRLNKFLSGLAAVLLAFSLCNAASAAPLTKIRTAWMDSYETFAMWYAKEKGWDKEAGLDIDILFFDSGMAILNALPAGEWQYSCLGGVPAMMGNLRYGTSVIGVGTDESACVAVLARPDNPVFKTKGLNPKHPGVFGSPEDVRGKTILCTTVSSAHFALTAWLDAVGVKPTEVTIKNMDQPQALAAFENGIGDFVALWAPHMYAGTDKGWKVAGSAALCGKGTPLVLVADTKYADAHPEITAKFLSVYLRGVEHLRTTSVDDLIPEYQRFFFDWAGKTYSKELARLDLESHPAWDIKGQLALFDTSKGMSTVQQWQADTAQFFASIGSITPDELKKGGKGSEGPRRDRRRGK